MSLRTAAELDLFDIDVPDGMAISVYPPAREHMEDSLYYDSGGRDPIDQRKIFRMSPGQDQKDQLAKVLEDYPRYGPKFYEKAARAGRADIIHLLLELGASLDVEAAKAPDSNGIHENEANNDDDDDVEDHDEEVDEEGSDEDEENGEAKEGDDDHDESENDDDGDDEDELPQVNMDLALHVAAFEGHLDCVKVLIEEGHVEVNSKDNNNTTALTSASVNGHTAIVEYLLTHGADIVFNREESISDIHAALKSGKVDLLKLLLNSPQSLSSGFSVPVGDVYYAALSGSPDMLNFAMENAGYPPPGDEPSHSLSEEQKNNIIVYLPHSILANDLHSLRHLLSYLTPRLPNGSLEYYGGLDERDVSRVFNATEDAMEEHSDPVAVFELAWETLLSPTASILENNPDALATRYERLNRRLITACTNGCPQTVRLLVESYGADVNHVSHKYFTTPLSRAAASSAVPLPGRLAVARYLLEETKVNIHLASGDYANGATALARTINEGQGQAEMVRVLLEHGGPIEVLGDGITDLFERMDIEGEKVLIYVTNARLRTRYPIELLTQAEWESSPNQDELSYVKLEVSKDELARWISGMQLRKRDAVLLAEDSKGRPLEKERRVKQSHEA